MVFIKEHSITKKTIQSVVMALILCAVQSLVWAQGKFDLKYEEIEDDTDALIRASRSYQRTVLNKPSELKVLPKELSEKISYLVMPIGGQKVLFVIDAGSEKAKLYVDMDMDGDLSDEKPLTNVGKEGQIMFGPFSIPVLSDDMKMEIRIKVEGWLWNDRATLIFYPAVVRTGEVKLGGESFKLALVDKNLDGRYDGYLKPDSPDYTSGCDYIAIDLSRDGEFDSSSSGVEIFPLSRMVRVEGSYYSIEPSPDGSAIDIREITPKFGTLDVQNPDMELSLTSDTGPHNLSASGGKWKLPAGNYETKMIQLEKKDKAGISWVLRCYGWRAGKLARFEIREGETLTIEAGPPLIIRTETSMRRNIISIGFSVLGRADEQYDADVKKDGKKQPPPRLRIVDKSGKELVKGSFQYG